MKSTNFQMKKGASKSVHLGPESAITGTIINYTGTIVPGRSANGPSVSSQLLTCFTKLDKINHYEISDRPL